MAIVVGYVPTKEGRAALRRAADEALLRKSKLDRHQLQPRWPRLRRRRGEAGSRPSSRASRASSTRQGLEHEVRQLVRGNEPAEDLIAVAEEEHADFIVIGLRRRTPVGKLILGSNAQRILLDASCPVLAVKADA